MHYDFHIKVHIPVTEEVKSSFEQQKHQASNKNIHIKCPQSQGLVECANGALKTKIAKIMADLMVNSPGKMLLPLALISMRLQTNRLTHLTLHEMLTGRPMPLPQCRDPIEGSLL